MGVYYYYANFTRYERFCIDSLGGGMKRAAIGNTLASRAFHLMLTGEPGGTVAALPETAGRWVGDSIAIVGDDHLPDWEQFQQEFTDIEANAILLVFRADGFERLGEAAEKQNSFFMQLCYLVATRQVLDLEPHLKKQFGAHYLRRYKAFCQKDPRFLGKDLAVDPKI
ncbi:MAG TPA: hypothetical protein VFE47_24900 [Tepidisphaeraceae bacterium]|jgi:hypothetical protein|nr:hypothetical protein [Tepidisphaeraceae bacterium]